MQETNQPFTDLVTKKQTVRGAGTQPLLWWILALALVLTTAGLVYYRSIAKQTGSELKSVQTNLEKATERLTDATDKDSASQEEISKLKARLAEMEKEQEKVQQKAKGLEDEMREQLESKDITISKLQGKLTVNILDRVMFDSGEAVLKPAGEAVMSKIADLLRDHPELKIHVIGHTDNIPIRPEAHSRFASNWELSTARALAALHFLTDKSGVDPRRLGAVGYGEFRPIADNATVEGRAQNRRIAIVILPDELLEAETQTGMKNDGATSSEVGK